MYLKLVKEGANNLGALFTMSHDTLLHDNIGVQSVDSFERLVNQRYSKII